METLGFIIVFALIFILHKKGIIRFRVQTKIWYKSFHTPKSYKASYKKFDGIEYYRFWVKKGSKVTVTYDVSVESGSLLLEFWHTTKSIYFQQEFNQSASGAFSFIANKRMYTLRLEGLNTKGECEVQVEKK